MIYLDNSATTRTSDAAAKKAYECMTTAFGNPSSLHSLGFRAELEIKEAKRALASALSCREGEIFFTSGGTEANNTAILGTAFANRRRGNKIVVSAVEHSSVLDAAKLLSQNGFEVVFVQPQKDGIIDPSDIANAVDDKTILVSLMLVNNETGAIMDVATAAAGARRRNPKVIVHCDAVQAFCKIPVNVGKLGADLLTVSAHKVYAPKGCGALYVKKQTRISPIIYGGEQQNKFRPGTENTPAITAFSLAVSENIKSMSENYKRVKELSQLALSKLSNIPEITVNSPQNALPYVVNFSTNSIKSETLIHFMEGHDIYISGGSACAKGNRSHVLSAMKLSDRAVDTAVRVSFSHENTAEDVKEFVKMLKTALDSLQKIK